tara:strand:+ start:27 stop:251 length:225 start_codon:yes stop_codon:yes gene_type:complete
MKIINHNSTILEPVNQETGFITGKYEDPNVYAAVPIVGSTTRLAIIFKGNVIKECRNRQSAINFIDRHSKRKKQ